MGPTYYIGSFFPSTLPQLSFFLEATTLFLQVGMFLVQQKKHHLYFCPEKSCLVVCGISLRLQFLRDCASRQKAAYRALCHIIRDFCAPPYDRDNAQARACVDDLGSLMLHRRIECSTAQRAEHCTEHEGRPFASEIMAYVGFPRLH